MVMEPFSSNGGAVASALDTRAYLHRHDRCNGVDLGRRK
jgi:hypothetical protein